QPGSGGDSRPVGRHAGPAGTFAAMVRCGYHRRLVHAAWPYRGATTGGAGSGCASSRAVDGAAESGGRTSAACKVSFQGGKLNLEPKITSWTSTLTRRRKRSPFVHLKGAQTGRQLPSNGTLNNWPRNWA